MQFPADRWINKMAAAPSYRFHVWTWGVITFPEDVRLVGQQFRFPPKHPRVQTKWVQVPPQHARRISELWTGRIESKAEIDDKHPDVHRFALAAWGEKCSGSLSDMHIDVCARWKEGLNKLRDQRLPAFHDDGSQSEAGNPYKHDILIYRITINSVNNKLSTFFTKSVPAWVVVSIRCWFHTLIRIKFC